MTDQFDNHPTEPIPAGQPGADATPPGSDATPPSATPPSATPPGQDVASPRIERGNVTSSPGEPPGEPPPRGRVRYQDPATARARPPSLAEQRARQVAERERRRKEIAEVAEADRKSKLRRRLMIGGGVTVGVVALVAIWYAASRPKDVTAYCVADDDVVTDDNNCDQRYVTTTGGGYYSGGFFFIGGRQYHYYYGGNPTPLGGHVSGGSTVKPKGASITTRSGKTIQRGGFGIRGGSGKSSGS
jgi:hypothetical protein